MAGMNDEQVFETIHVLSVKVYDIEMKYHKSLRLTKTADIGNLWHLVTLFKIPDIYRQGKLELEPFVFWHCKHMP